MRRPVALRVVPDGVHAASFYQRDVPEDAPSWFPSTAYETVTDGCTIRIPLIDNVAGLVWLADQGSIEFHLWSSRVSDLTVPDQVVFDLDPGDQATFADVLQAALYLSEELERLGFGMRWPPAGSARPTSPCAPRGIGSRTRATPFAPVAPAVTSAASSAGECVTPRP